MVDPERPELRRDAGDTITRVAAEERVGSPERAYEAFLREAHVTAAHELPGLVSRHVQAFGATDAAIHLADLQQRVLVRFDPDASPGSRERLGIDATVAGRAYQLLQVQRQAQQPDDAGAVTVWLPLVDGTDRLGVLQVTVDAAALDTGGELLLMRLQRFTSLVAELVVSRTPYGDVIVRERRTSPMSLAAEMQWSLLPPLTFADGSVSVAGGLEPAYDVAGDSLDYAVDRGVTHFAVFDAMGHGLSSAQLVNLAVGAYRHGRRSGATLPACATAVDEAIAASYGGDAFSTGIVAQLDTSTGDLRWVSAGHPQPLLMREGRLVRALEAEVSLPFGLGHHRPGSPPVPGQESLQPGDLVLLYTDGVVEARSPEGAFFGVERLTDLVLRNLAAGLPAAETMRRVVHALLDHQGAELTDDATLLLVEWHGGADAGGASPRR